MKKEKKKKKISEEKKEEAKQERDFIVKSDDKTLEKEIKTELISNGFQEFLSANFSDSKVVLDKINNFTESDFQEEIIGGQSSTTASRDGSRIYTSNSPQYTSENVNAKNEEMKYSSDSPKIVLTPTGFNQPRFELMNIPRENSRNDFPVQIISEVETPRKKLPFEMREEKYKRIRLN